MMKTTDRPIGKVQAQDLQRDVAMDLRQLKKQLSEMGVVDLAELRSFPHSIGEPVALLVDECPDLCLPLEGGGFSVTEFPELFGAYGYMYGGSDGTFYVPDMRGLVLKGWNHGKAAGIYDLEAATRTGRGDGTTGDNVGTLQKFMMQGWQLGILGLNYWGRGNAQNYVNSHVANAGDMSVRFRYNAQGGSDRLVGVDDGVNGPPLVGKQTNDSNIAVYWVTRYAWTE